MMRDKVVVVTGASSGIGRATALHFAGKGAQLVIAARSAKGLEETANAIKAKGGNVLSVVADVSKEEDCKSLIEQSVEKFQNIHVLINNAGISMRATLEDVELSVLKKLMAVNFWGMVYCTKYALPHLLKTKGSVVGVSSIAGYVGLPARTGYSASKFAMHGFLEALRTENLANGLHVLITCPGFTESNIRKQALNASGDAQSESPRKEEKMMTAEEVAKEIYEATSKRRSTLVLTSEGKAAVFLSKFFPSLIRKMVYQKMKSEPDSPIK
jgi:short-subunit dehydrogenase